MDTMEKVSCIDCCVLSKLLCFQSNNNDNFLYLFKGQYDHLCRLLHMQIYDNEKNKFAVENATSAHINE
jgi:hypothetical protein